MSTTELNGPDWKQLVLRNVGTGKCLAFVPESEAWSNVQVKPCNGSDARQQFHFFENKNIKNGQQCATVTHARDSNLSGNPLEDIRMIGCSDQWNGVNDRRNTFKEFNPFRSAPFIIQGDTTLDRAWQVDSNGVVRNLASNASDPNQQWVPDSLAQSCLENEIPLGSCTVQKLCATNPTLGICAQYCGGDEKVREGECDEWAKAYCAKNPDQLEGFCACINLPKGAPSGVELDSWNKVAARPECFLKNCSADARAYKLTSQRKGPACSPLTLCVQQIGNNAASNLLSQVKVEQNCSSNGSGGGSNSNSQNTNTKLDVTVKSTVVKGVPDTVLFGGIGITLFLIVIIIIVFVS